MKNNSILVFLGILCFCFWLPMAAGEKVVEHEEGDLYGRWSPVVTVPGSMRAELARRLFTEKDYQFSLLPSLSYNEEYYEFLVVHRKGEKHHCVLKRIARDDLLRDGKFACDLVDDCHVDLKSAVIDEHSVAVLSRYLKRRTSTAVYHTQPPGKYYLGLDGQSFQVYVKGAKNDAYDDYSASVLDHFLKTGRSCSTIFHVLYVLVVADDVKPLRQLVEFYESLEEGEAPVADPFFKPSSPAPDVVLPPVK